MMQAAQINALIDTYQSSRDARRVVILQQVENDLRRAQQSLQRAAGSMRPTPAHISSALNSTVMARTSTLRQIEFMGVPAMPIKIGFRTDFDREHTISLNAGSCLCTMSPVALKPFQAMRSPFECRISDVGALLVQAQRLGWEREIDALIRSMHPTLDEAVGPKLTERILREPWQVVDFSTNWPSDMAQCLRFRQPANAEAGGQDDQQDTLSHSAGGPDGAGDGEVVYLDRERAR